MTEVNERMNVQKVGEWPHCPRGTWVNDWPPVSTWIRPHSMGLVAVIEHDPPPVARSIEWSSSYESQFCLFRSLNRLTTLWYGIYASTHRLEQIWWPNWSTVWACEPSWDGDVVLGLEGKELEGEVGSFRDGWRLIEKLHKDYDKMCLVFEL